VVVGPVNAVATPALYAKQQASVDCPPGTFALGGGGIVVGADADQDVTIWASQPINISPPTGWFVAAEQGAAGVPANPTWSVTPYVVCST
jgi:hypothetical protein